MHACEPRLRDQFGPVHRAADNDNLPEALRPRTLRPRPVNNAIEDPAAFFLYLLMTGVVCTLGYLIALSAAVGLK